MAEGILVPPAHAMNNMSNNISPGRSNSLSMTTGGGYGGILSSPDVAQAERMLSTVRPGAASAAGAMHHPDASTGGMGTDNLSAAPVGGSPVLSGAGHGRAQPSFMPQNNLPNAAASAFQGAGNTNTFPREAATIAAGAGMGLIDPAVILARRERDILVQRQEIEERLAAHNAAAAFGGAGGQLSGGAGHGPGAAFNPTPLNRQQEEFLLMRRELELRRDLQALQQHRLRMQEIRLQEQHQQARAAAAAAQQAAAEGGFSSSQRGDFMQPPGAVLSGPGTLLSGGNNESVSPLKFSDAQGAAAETGHGGSSSPGVAVAAPSVAAPHSPSKIQQLLEIASQVEIAKQEGTAGPEASAGIGITSGPSISPSPLLTSAASGTPPPAKEAGKVGSASSSSGKKYGSPPGETASQRAKKRARTFAMKLMDALVHRKNDEAVAWLPDGKSFVIIDSFKFMREVYPHSFKECKYESFVRKLNQWGFTRLTSGTGVDCFSHKFFQRDRIDLVMEMRCLDWRVRRRDARANSGEEGK